MKSMTKEQFQERVARELTELWKRSRERTKFLEMTPENQKTVTAINMKLAQQPDPFRKRALGL